MKVLVAYDISHDGARARAAAILQQWGDRVQKSVFLCQLGPDELAAVIAEIEAGIDPQTDALMAVPLCASCHGAVSFLGQYHEPPTSACWVVI